MIQRSHPQSKSTGKTTSARIIERITKTNVLPFCSCILLQKMLHVKVTFNFCCANYGGVVASVLEGNN